MAKSPLRLDERNLRVIHVVSCTMYLLTLLALVAAIAYRQFVLRQVSAQFEDLAVILTANVLVLIGAVVYFGGITVGRVRPLLMVGVYLGFVLSGFLFTLLKYALLERPLNLGQALSKLWLIAVICGVLVLGFTLFAYLGNRRMEKKLE